MQILHLEDDPNVATAIGLLLKREGFEVCHVENAEEATEYAFSYNFALIISDYDLPGMDGPEFIRSLRSQNIDTPIIVLSGRHDPSSKAAGLNAGADDFMTKPYNGPELVARIKAVARRSRGTGSPIVTTGDLHFDLNTCEATIAGQTLHLTRTQRQLLELLVLNKGRCVTRVAMLDCLYAGGDEPEISTVNAFVHYIRKKIRAVTGGPWYIETVWGTGYVLKDPK